MNVLKHTILSILALLFLNSCTSDSNDVDDDGGTSGGITEKALRIELKPILPHSNNVISLSILLSVHSPNQTVDVEGQIYDDKENVDVTQSLFDYKITDNTNTLSFSTTEKVFNAGITLLIVTDGSVNIDRSLYELSVYGDNKLLKKETLVLPKQNISNLFNPLINWDYF